MFIYVISLLLIICGIVGVFIPSLPGLLLSFSGLVVFAIFSGVSLPTIWLVSFGVLTLLSIALEYLIPVATSNKYGGSSWGNIGGYLGLIVGFFSPLPMGFLIFMFLGIFVGEYLNSSSTQVALRAVKGAFIGFLYSTGFNFVVGIAMLVCFFYYGSQLF